MNVIYRNAVLRLFRNPIAARPLLVNNNVTALRMQGKTTLKHPNNLLNKPSMFSLELIKKNYEISPLIIIVGLGVVGLVYAIIRNGITRDDVRFSKDIPMNCEKFEEQPKSRKFITFNQKYKTPEGLVEALQALEDPNESEKKASKK